MLCHIQKNEKDYHPMTPSYLLDTLKTLYMDGSSSVVVGMPNRMFLFSNLKSPKLFPEYTEFTACFPPAPRGKFILAIIIGLLFELG